MKLNIGPAYFEHGYLSSMLRTLLSKGSVKKLENQVLTHIASTLAVLAHEQDIYELLFNDEDRVIKRDNTSIHTKDLAAFVLMDNQFTRGYFSKTAGRNAMSDTTNCSGVPLLLEGSKRLFKKNYMSWLDEWEDKKRLDVFLPSHLASYTLSSEGWEQAEKLGLLVFHRYKVNIRPEIVIELQQRLGNFNTPNPKMLDALEEDTSEMREVLRLYNRASYRMRNMILRGWCWNEVCRNSSMICDWNDWDNIPSKLDQLAGLQPLAATGLDPYEKFLGIKL